MKLNFQDAVQYIHDNPEVYLQPDRSGKGFICPICGSGQGKHGTGITTKSMSHSQPNNLDNIHFTCFAKGCFEYADVIDIIGKAEGLDDKQKYSRAFEIYGIEIDETAEPKPKQKKPKKEEPEQPDQDYTDYYKRCAEDLQNSWTNNCYMAKRGISKETCRKKDIGIDRHFKTRDAVTGEFVEWEVIIIPTGKGTYVARNTDPICDTSNRIRNRGKATPFNLEVLKTDIQPVFIVEGEIDSLSIEEAGGASVGLGGINAGVRKVFLDAVKECNKKHKYIIALDHETEPDKIETIRQTAEELRQDLNELGAVAYVLDPFEGHKDANEALKKCRHAFIKNIRGISFSFTDRKQPEREDNNSGILWERMKKKSIENEINGLLDEIDRTANQEIIPTGFPQLDELLSGGLHPELYLLYAPTATGKTMFISQICDQIAQQGHYTEFFNLEMSNQEMISRSISRHTALNVINGEAGGKIRNAKMSVEIMNGSLWGKYSKEEKELIAKSFRDYESYANEYIRYHESFGYLDTNDIRESIDYCIATTGQTPTIFVDYIQMLSLGIAFREKKSITERQAIDKAILDLKQISRDYHTAVIVVSAVNRETSKSKTAEIELESGKESGSLEFTAGVVMSLDYEVKGNGDHFDLDEEIKRNPRQMKVKILKNRHASSRKYVLFNLYPKYSLFTEREDR